MKLLPLLLLMVTALHADFTDDLCEMARADQEARRGGIQFEECEADQIRTARLKEIIAEQGWPIISEVGLPAANAAWLIAQHSTHDPEFMAYVLDLITPHLETGEIRAEWFALLTDRVLVLNGEPQLYGTQYQTKWIHGILSLIPSTPILEPHLLAKRRATLGLIPHFQYLTQLASMIDAPQ